MNATKEFLLERPQFFARALLYVLFALIILTVLLSWFATINIKVVGVGEISVVDDVKNVYTLEENNIQEQIFVKKGDFVTDKQVLAVIKVDNEYQTLISPCEGVVTFAQSWSKSFPLKNDVPAFVIVPKSDNLIAKLEISSANMKNIHINQKLQLKIDAYPYRNFGVWQAEIKYISATTKINPAGINVYEVVADIDKVEAAKKSKQLIVGQSLQAEIIVERKRVLTYLVDFIRGVGVR